MHPYWLRWGREQLASRGRHWLASRTESRSSKHLARISYSSGNPAKRADHADVASGPRNALEVTKTTGNTGQGIAVQRRIVDSVTTVHGTKSNGDNTGSKQSVKETADGRTDESTPRIGDKGEGKDPNGMQRAKDRTDDTKRITGFEWGICHLA